MFFLLKYPWYKENNKPLQLTSTTSNTFPPHLADCNFFSKYFHRLTFYKCDCPFSFKIFSSAYFVQMWLSTYFLQVFGCRHCRHSASVQEAKIVEMIRKTKICCSLVKESNEKVSAVVIIKHYSNRTAIAGNYHLVLSQK